MLILLLHSKEVLHSHYEEGILDSYWFFTITLWLSKLATKFGWTGTYLYERTQCIGNHGQVSNPAFDDFRGSGRHVFKSTGSRP